MRAEISFFHKKKGYIKNSNLVLLAFSSAFFSRLLQSAKVPSIINFLHFVAVPFACGFIVMKTRTKNRFQILVAKEILFGLLIFLSLGFASALLNNVGMINVVLSFLLWAEPFMLLLAIVSIPIFPASTQKFRLWLVRFGLINTLLALVQRFILRFDLITEGFADNIQGVFYRSGAGHVVSASVALTFGVYYFITASTRPLSLRATVLFATFVHLVAADAKQVLLSFLIGFILLCLVNLKDIKKAFIYVTGAVIFFLVFNWGMENIEALSGFKTWIRPEIYGPDGEATNLKISGIRIIISHFHSPLNWLFGLGSGHTIDRLGGWMLKDYKSLLEPLGATMTPIGDEVWAAVTESWLGNQTSMFSPFFGWAAIWGDFGFLGLGAYLYLCFIVWRRLCLDDFSKFLMLSVFACGLVFTQMQEPGYMLYISILIGGRWQELHGKQI